VERSLSDPFSYGACCVVEENAKGQIWVLSHDIEAIDGWIEDYWKDGLDEFYRRRIH
jgi:hypothetical protein